MAPVKRQLIIYLSLFTFLLFYYVFHHHQAPSSSSPHLFLSSPSYRPPNLPTTLLVSIAGFNHFESLYLKNGTVYLLSPPDAEDVYDPLHGGGGGFVDRSGVGLLPLWQLTSTGRDSGDHSDLRDPTEKEIQILRWEDRGILELDKRKVLRIEGTTILINDAGTIFLDHFYHMWAEIILGAWKSLALASDQKEDYAGNTNIEDPRRIMFSHAKEENWRDRPGLNGYLFKAIFPSTAFEHRLDWEERMATGRTYVFDKVVLVDRSAGSRGDKCGGPAKHYFKMNANIFDAPGGSPNWAQPIRQRLLATLPSSTPSPVPIITYISRQGRGRSLRQEDHTLLVKSLEKMVERNGWVLEVPTMELMTKEEQFALAGRTTVLIGVHGNGLTHQLWMAPTPFSTVIEIFINKGINYDYALPATVLGHKHFTVWSDGEGTYQSMDTMKVEPSIEWPEDFHGKDIRVDGPTVVRVIEQRLAGWRKGV